MGHPMDLFKTPGQSQNGWRAKQSQYGQRVSADGTDPSSAALAAGQKANGRRQAGAGTVGLTNVIFAPSELGKTLVTGRSASYGQLGLLSAANVVASGAIVNYFMGESVLSFVGMGVSAVLQIGYGVVF